MVVIDVDAARRDPDSALALTTGIAIRPIRPATRASSCAPTACPGSASRTPRLCYRCVNQNSCFIEPRGAGRRAARPGRRSRSGPRVLHGPRGPARAPAPLRRRPRLLHAPRAPVRRRAGRDEHDVFVRCLAWARADESLPPRSPRWPRWPWRSDTTRDGALPAGLARASLCAGLGVPRQAHHALGPSAPWPSPRWPRAASRVWRRAPRVTCSSRRSPSVRSAPVASTASSAGQLGGSRDAPPARHDVAARHDPAPSRARSPTWCSTSGAGGTLLRGLRASAPITRTGIPVSVLVSAPGCVLVIATLASSDHARLCGPGPRPGGRAPRRASSSSPRDARAARRALLQRAPGLPVRPRGPPLLAGAGRAARCARDPPARSGRDRAGPRRAARRSRRRACATPLGARARPDPDAGSPRPARVGGVPPRARDRAPDRHHLPRDRGARAALSLRHPTGARLPALP